MAKRITCINKQDRDNPYERLTHIGGAGWRITQEEGIRQIEAEEESFYVEEPPGDPAEVEVATSPYGNEYLKTVADADVPNNLLSLPEC